MSAPSRPAQAGRQSGHNPTEHRATHAPHGRKEAAAKGAALGARIAAHRKASGYSQQYLATRLNRSKSWVSMVERGTRAVDRLSTLEAVAASLGIDIAELVGVPGLMVAEPGERRDIARAIRRAMTTYPHAEFAFDMGSWDSSYVAEGSTKLFTDVRPLVREVLGETIEQCWARVELGAFVELGSELPRLIQWAHTAPQTDPGHAPWQVASEVYQITAITLTAAGETDLAWLAADRAIAAAQQAGDLAEGATALLRVGQAFLTAGRHDEAMSVVRLGDIFARGQMPVAEPAGTRPNPGDPDGPPQMVFKRRGAPQAHAVAGAFALLGALAEARLGDELAADKQIASARDHAVEAAKGTDAFHLGFSQAAVSVTSIAVDVELGRVQHALEDADDLDVSGLPPAKQAEFWIEVARAHERNGNLPMAVELILRAEVIAEGYVHGHWAVQTLVASILGRKRLRVGRKLDKLARRFGLL